MQVFYKKNGFKIRALDGWETPEIFLKVQNLLREKASSPEGGNVLVNVTESKRKRIVLKAELNGRRVIIKRESFIFRFDRTLKAFLFGSNARSVFAVSLKALASGFRGIPEFYLCAEKYRYGILRECISVMEYLEGKTLPRDTEFSEEKKSEIQSLIENCHAHGIISGDIHSNNFIETPRDGLKLIDFCGRKIFPNAAKARDRAQLNRKFGITFPGNTQGDFVFKFFITLRNFGRRLRKQKSLPD